MPSKHEQHSYIVLFSRCSWQTRVITGPNVCPHLVFKPVGYVHQQTPVSMIIIIIMITQLPQLGTIFTLCTGHCVVWVFHWHDLRSYLDSVQKKVDKMLGEFSEDAQMLGPLGAQTQLARLEPTAGSAIDKTIRCIKTRLRWSSGAMACWGSTSGFGHCM